MNRQFVMPYMSDNHVDIDFGIRLEQKHLEMHESRKPGTFQSNRDKKQNIVQP